MLPIAGGGGGPPKAGAPESDFPDPIDWIVPPCFLNSRETPNPNMHENEKASHWRTTNVCPGLIVNLLVEELAVETIAMAFAVWLTDVAEAKASAIDNHRETVEACLTRSLRRYEALFCSVILKSRFNKAMKTRLIANRLPATASNPIMYDDWTRRANSIASEISVP